MGLLEDMIGFVGEKFRQQNEQRQQAFEQFQKTGHLPPGLMSGVAGVISPGTWGDMGPEAKATVNMLADKFPSFFEKIMSDPRELNIVTKAAPRAPDAAGFGSLAEYAGGKIGLTPEVHGQIPVMAHEMQHYLNEPGMEGLMGTGKSAGDASEDFATRIWRQLPSKGRASLSQRLGQVQMLKAGAVPEDLKDIHDAVGTDLTTQLIQHTAKDEALAHLSEHTARPGTSSKLQDLARESGVGVGEAAPAYQQQPGLLGSIMGLFGGQ